MILLFLVLFLYSQVLCDKWKTKFPKNFVKNVGSKSKKTVKNLLPRGIFGDSVMSRSGPDMREWRDVVDSAYMSRLVYGVNTVSQAKKKLGDSPWKVVDVFDTSKTKLFSKKRLKNGFQLFLSDTDIMILKNRDRMMVVFRGTEMSVAKDVIADLKVARKIYKYCKLCFVHQGFLRATQQVLPKLKSILNKKNLEGIKTIIVTGHSLGGAQATVFAAYVHDVLKFRGNIDLYTFGQPRVGNMKFIKHVTKNTRSYLRVVNDQDIVTRIPPKFMGFSHYSKKVMQTKKDKCSFRFGKVLYNKMNIKKIFGNKFKYAEGSIKNSLANHKMNGYVKALKCAVKHMD